MGNRYVDTPLLHSESPSEYMKNELLKVPLGRLATQEEAADGIAFLASPMASFMVGATLVADGGYSIQ
jgi:NAD(P)-dependent dehydrogenase (short-subunit alcohol dehydrogenase family)